MEVRQNNSDAEHRPRWQTLVLSTIATVLGLATFYVVLVLMLANLYPSEPPLAEGELPPAERIRQLQAEDHRQLTSYGLINREQGVWRIPIDVAMEKLIAERDGQPGNDK